MLPVNFLAMVVVNDAGTTGIGLVYGISKCIVNIFLLPVNIIEGLFHKELFTGNLFFIGDVFGMIGWATIFVVLYRFSKKAVYNYKKRQRA